MSSFKMDVLDTKRRPGYHEVPRCPASKWMSWIPGGVLTHSLSPRLLPSESDSHQQQQLDLAVNLVALPLPTHTPTSFSKFFDAITYCIHVGAKTRIYASELAINMRLDMA